MKIAMTLWYYTTLAAFITAIIFWWLPTGGSIAAWAIISTVLYVATDWMQQYWDNIPKQTP